MAVALRHGWRWPPHESGAPRLRSRARRSRVTVRSALSSPAREGLGKSDGKRGIEEGRPPSPAKTGVPGKLEADVVVIGSGIGGLCCGALLARYGLDVLVCESHTIAGGAAHAFEHRGFHFDSGPSLFSGLGSRGPAANPLAQVLDALGERVPCAEYDSWMVHVPEGDFLTRIGPTQFFEVLEKYVGSGAVADWGKLLAAVKPLLAAAMALPPAALRADAGVALTAAARYAPAVAASFLKAGPAGLLRAGQLLGPFSALLDSADVRDPFVRNWVDLLAFLLSGLKADGTLAAEIVRGGRGKVKVYMFGEWYRPNCVLDYPLGGTGAIVNALLCGLEKHGGRLALGCHVAEVMVEGSRAVGVRLRDGTQIKARKAVVSNASVWDTQKLLPEGALPQEEKRRAEATPECDSFMHLHAGFDRKDVPSDLEIHHIVVNDWDLGVDAPQNVVLLSIPSVLDPSLAPAGKHCLHAYTPGSEPHALWEGLDRKSAEYRLLKEKRAEVLWRAAERALGPAFKRERCEVALVGTPLTHARYLCRARGTYGPAIQAGKGSFPGPRSSLEGLLYCGDSIFPGIGVPAVAASGMVAANSLAPIWDHWKLLDAMGL